MTTHSTLEASHPRNPFQKQSAFSNPAVSLMRGLSAQRKRTGQSTASPEQILQTVAEIGYRQPSNATLPVHMEARRFVRAMSGFQEQHGVTQPTCENVLQVLYSLGYYRHYEEPETSLDGLPIDRRRREEDARNSKTERRSSLEPSAQELLELSYEEHQFLDALKALRESTGRDFASSEELLSILWDIGYRPVSEAGLPVAWLDDEERCRIQVTFTHAVEDRLAVDADSEFLTCRSMMEIVAEQGFAKVG